MNKEGQKCNSYKTLSGGKYNYYLIIVQIITISATVRSQVAKGHHYRSRCA